MEWSCGNVFIRPNQGNKGDKIKGHAHNFDHVTICLRGAISVKRLSDGMIRKLYTPSDDSPVHRAHVLILAGVEHEIDFLEDNSAFWCVYAHRTPQGKVVQEFTGWGDSYN
jgi:hypothetical protein